ncbi:MAG: hypothetical protein AAGG56_07815 [Pseudomonadota bacterium]
MRVLGILTAFALVAAGVALLPDSAAADCDFNGQSYQEGDRVGSYECRGGQWVTG